MRILHISDLHFGGEDIAAIAAVTEHVEAAPPDVIVASGDLSCIGTQKELDAAFKWLGSLGPPVIATPGNHDVPYLEVLPRFYAPLRRYERAAREVGAREAWFGEGVRIVTINTARGWQLRPNWALGAISRRQIDDAIDALRETPPHFLRIVVTHHPLMFPPDSPLRGLTHGGNGAAMQLIEAGAQVFLSGHLHTNVEERLAGRAISLGAGTLSKRLRGQPPGFLELECHNNTQLALTRYAVLANHLEAKCDLLTLP